MGHGPTIAMELCTRRPASVAGLPWPGGSVFHAKPNHGCPLFPNLQHHCSHNAFPTSGFVASPADVTGATPYVQGPHALDCAHAACILLCVCLPPSPHTPHGRLATLRACHGPPLAALAVVAVPTCGQTVTGTCGSPTTSSMRSVWPGRLSCTCTLPRRLQMTARRRLRQLGGARPEVEAIHTGTAPDPRMYESCLRVAPALRSESGRRAPDPRLDAVAAHTGTAPHAHCRFLLPIERRGYFR